ncbi:MAG: NAD(P)-dependent oxidoreductase [Chloroflexota bacterium]|nr:MAG: NAD(P)-dependent oxidoreductase [Chloroflexota bacterium]
MRTGLIGLGTMGSRFARRLVGGGFPPAVFDIDRATVERVVAVGGHAATSVSDVVARADVIFTSLPMPGDVESVVVSALGDARPNHIFVDLSTIDPATARRLAEKLAERGAAFLDAPVSGGPGGAEAGTLAVMVGGSAEAFARARPCFETFSGRLVHCGSVGSGSVVKLANQMLVGAHVVAAAEAVRFARESGIAPETLLEVVSAATGDSAMLRRTIKDYVLTDDFTPTFALRLLMKDLRLYAAESRSLGTIGPAGKAAVAAYEEAMARGLAGLDYAAVIKTFLDGA